MRAIPFLLLSVLIGGCGVQLADNAPQTSVDTGERPNSAPPATAIPAAVREIALDDSFGTNGKFQAFQDDGFFSAAPAFTVDRGRQIFGGHVNRVLGAKIPYSESRIAIVSEAGSLLHLEKRSAGQVLDVTTLEDGSIRSALFWDIFAGRGMIVWGLKPDGTTDEAFGTNGIQSFGIVPGEWAVSTSVARANGALYVAGGSGFPTTPIVYSFAIAKLAANGEIEAKAVLPLQGTIRRLVALADGKLLALGPAHDQSRFYCVRILPDLSLDTSFGAGGVVEIPLLTSGSVPKIAGLAVKANGNYVVGLNEQQAQASTDPFGDATVGNVVLAELHPSGGLTSHRTVLTGSVVARDIAVYKTGVLVGLQNFIIADVRDGEAGVRLRDASFVGSPNRPARLFATESTVTMGGLLGSGFAAIRLTLP